MFAGIAGKTSTTPRLCPQSHENVTFGVRPISFSIPKQLILQNVRVRDKLRNFAVIIPGRDDTYVYTEQDEYYMGYKESKFAVTMKKGGWDCLRHYEIVAAGCVPYMLQAEAIPIGTMWLWPANLLRSVLELKGLNHALVKDTTVANGTTDSSLIDEPNFDMHNYTSIMQKLQAHLRKHLTTESMAKYLMSFSSVQPSNILFVGTPDSERHYPDYQAETLFHGLRTVFGFKVVDVPKRGWMYTNHNKSQHHLYGMGFSYASLLPDLDVDRAGIEDKIQSRHFTHVVFGVTQNGRHPWIDLVRNHLPMRNVFFVDGSDTGGAETNTLFAEVCSRVGMCFRRELLCESREAMT